MKTNILQFAKPDQVNKLRFYVNYAQEVWQVNEREKNKMLVTVADFGDDQNILQKHCEEWMLCKQ